VDDAQGLVALPFPVRVQDDAEGDQIVDLVDLDPLGLHLAVDAEVVLRPALHLALEAEVFHLALDDAPHFLRVLVALFLALGDALHEIVVGLGVEVLEGQILQLHPDPVDPEAVGQGCVELEGLRGYGDFPLFGLELEGAHVVHPVRKLHQDDPDVGRHGEDHLAEVLRLPLLAAGECDLGEFREPVDEGGDLFAEPLLDLLEGGERVLYGVVQDAGHDRRCVEFHVGQDVGHFHGVRKVGFAGQTHLPGVDRGRKDVGLLDPFQVRRGGVLSDLIEDVRYSDHSGPSAPH